MSPVSSLLVSLVSFPFAGSQLLIPIEDGRDALCGDGKGELYGDLNRVSEKELAAAKASMEETFEKHAMRPGEVGYEYDRRVDFEPVEASGWDEDDESFGG